MLFRPILLMTMPPGDDDLTRPGTPYMPDIADTTQPIVSPYPADPGAPPPPPGTGPVPVWNPARPQLPHAARSASRPNGLLFVAGMLVAVALVAFAGIAFALSQNHGNPSSGNSTLAHTGTATPSPTKAPTTTPTVAPTAQPTTAPANQSGFSTYTSDSIWTIQYPNGTNIQTTTTTAMQGIPVPATMFSTRHSQFQIADLPVQVPGNPQDLLNQIAASLNLQDIQIIDQGPLTINSITWQMLHIRATSQGTRFEAILLYTTHDTGATIISMSAPVKFFDQSNNNIFQPMMQSFTYTSP